MATHLRIQRKVTSTLTPLSLVVTCLSLFCCNTKKPTEPDPNYFPVGPMAMAPAWSPDGESIMYLRAGYTAGNIPDHINRLNVQTGIETIVIEKGFTIDHMDWSPDGRWLVFESWGKLYKMRAEGDSITRLTGGPNDLYPNWSPDGSRIVFDAGWGSDSVGIYTMRPDGTDIRHVASFGYAEDWLPGGDTLVGILYPDTAEYRHIALFPVVNPSPTVISKCSFYAYACAMSPDGKRIAYEDKDAPGVRNAIFLLSRGDTIPERISLSPLNRDPAWSPDGRYVVYANVSDGALYTYDTQTRKTKRITPVLRVNNS